MRDHDGSSAISHGTLRWAIRTAAIAGFIGLAATQYFARADLGAHEPARVAGAAPGRDMTDPETTGSILKGSRSVRLDPCGLAPVSHRQRP